MFSPSSPKLIRRFRSGARAWLITATVSFCALVASAAPSLRDVLTPDEFGRAGLGKLTPEELEFLSARLLGNQTQPVPGVAAAATQRGPTKAAGAAAIAAVPSREATFGQEEQVAARATVGAPKEIRSRIRGAFQGWSGRTVFALENGQLWQQTDAGEFVVRLDSPEVVVRRGAFGAFYLRVAGYGAQVKVKRVN